MRSRSASRRATSAAANISAGRPSSPYTTARRQADTTQARSLPEPLGQRHDSSASAEPLRGGARAATARRTRSGRRRAAARRPRGGGPSPGASSTSARRSSNGAP